MMMMEDHKMRAPGKQWILQKSIHGGFKHQGSERRDNPEKRIIKFKNPVRTETYSDHKIRAPKQWIFQKSIHGGFKHHDSERRDNPEKKIIKLQNPVRTETYSSGNNSDSDSHRNTSANAISDSDKLHLQWSKTARRDRKSLSTSTLSYSSSEKQIVPFSGENKAVAQLSFSDHDSEDHRGSIMTSDEKEVEPFSGEKETVGTPLPLDFIDLKRKREIEDTNIIDFTKDITRTETNNCRDEIIFDILKETNFKATQKQAPGNFSSSCDNCGRTFNCHQALGGHKSSCKSNFPKGSELGECSLQGAMRKTNRKIDASSGPHKCKFCSMRFATGQALGGHQGIHRTTGQVKSRMGSWLSLSPTNDIMRKEASSVQEAQTNKKRKIMLFGCNIAESLPERMEIESF